MRISNKKELKPIQLQISLVPVCKIVIRLGVHFHEFIRNIQKAYIQAAEEILAEQNTSPSHQAIAVKTGMDRRTISEHRTNKIRSYTDPLNKMDMVIVQLQLFCVKKNSQKVAMQDLKKIIDSVYANHIRAVAVIKELVLNGVIVEFEESDDSYFEVSLNLPEKINKTKSYADEIDLSAKRLFQCFYENLFLKSDSTSKQKHSGQMLTVASTKIKPQKAAETKQQIIKKLKQCESEVKQILQKNESLVAEETFSEIGVTFFQFNGN